MKTNSIVAALTASVCVTALATPAQAEPRQFNIPPSSLKAALDAYGRQSGRPIIYRSQEVRRAKSNGYQGYATPEVALQAILAGTGFSFSATPGGAIAITSGESEAGSAAATDGSAEITVTGSRIRGAPIASQVIVVDHQAMEERGQTTVGDVIRSLPQAFGGGQNPGVSTTLPAAAGTNVDGASTANLRGLGSDATLTLLNGHRMAYNASRQGIDLSAIPFGMIERVEVVADGASALYGSDAVAGVVNVILKRNYEGLRVSADVGAATDGGYFQQQYGAVAGHDWGSGGLVAGYEFADNTNIVSNERSYGLVRPGVIFFPAMHHNAAAITAHQSITDNLSFAVDALYNYRSSLSGYAYNSAGDPSISHYDQSSTSRSFAIAPSLRLQLAKDWNLALSGVYGTETARYHNVLYTGLSSTVTSGACYCNAGKSIELSADGSLFDLPGGAVKLAAGAGYRVNSMVYDVGPIDASQSSTYGYGELSIPVVSSVQNIAAIDHLNLSGALRYERYPGIGSVVTPKLGIIYAPVSDLSIKGSWGRSFRAPTLYQQHSSKSVVVYSAASRGGTGYPADATVLYVGGGNINLKPERAESWAATLDYQPHQIKGLRLQGSYFSTVYRNRIVVPITYSTQALSNPLYSTWVDIAPTAASIDAAMANQGSFSNLSGTAYDPSKIAAIISNSNFNAGRQMIHGVDILVDYKTSLGRDLGVLSLSANAAYLVSHQQLIAGAAVTDLAGTLYNPPHWRGNVSLTWAKGGLSLNTATSVIGGITDTRTTTAISMRGMVTQDVTAHYAFGDAGGLLHGLALSLTIQNLFNDKPPIIATNYFYETSFDSTNYSPIGRYIGMGVTKSW